MYLGSFKYIRVGVELYLATKFIIKIISSYVQSVRYSRVRTIIRHDTIDFLRMKAIPRQSNSKAKMMCYVLCKFVVKFYFVSNHLFIT